MMVRWSGNDRLMSNLHLSLALVDVKLVIEFYYPWSRYTELSVSYRPQALLEGDTGQVRAVGADLWLEIRRDGGCWTRVPGDPIQRGSHRRLHRVEIHPCQVRRVMKKIINSLMHNV